MQVSGDQSNPLNTLTFQDPLLGREEPEPASNLANQLLTAIPRPDSSSDEKFYCEPERCKKIGLHLVFSSCLAAVIGLSILIAKRPSLPASTALSMALGASAHLGLKSELSKSSMTALNQFFVRWGFEIFEFLNQIVLNTDVWQGLWVKIDPFIVKRVIYTLMGVQAGNAVLSDLFALFNRLQPAQKPEALSLDFRPAKATAFFKDQKEAEHVSEMTKDHYVTLKQTLKISLGGLLILLANVLDVLKSDDKLKICECVGAGLIAHGAGVFFTDKVHKWQVIQKDNISLAIPCTPKSRQKKSNYLKLAEFLSKIAIASREIFAGVAIPLTHFLNSLPVGVASICLLEGATDGGIYRKFRTHRYVWYPDPAETEIEEPESCWEKTTRKVKEFYGDSKVAVLKTLLLGGVAGWFSWGATQLEEGPRNGIILFLITLVFAFVLTKSIDGHFKPNETSGLTRNFYYYLVQFPDYLFLLFIYIRYLNNDIGKNAYETRYGSMIADMALISLGLAAGNNRAGEDSSVNRHNDPRSNSGSFFTKSLLKTVLTAAVMSMFLDKLSE